MGKNKQVAENERVMSLSNNIDKINGKEQVYENVLMIAKKNRKL